MHDSLSIPHNSHDREPLGNPSVSYGTLGAENSEEHLMTYANIIVETHGAVGLIRLNRPQALNALSSP